MLKLPRYRVIASGNGTFSSAAPPGFSEALARYPKVLNNSGTTTGGLKTLEHGVETDAGLLEAALPQDGWKRDSIDRRGMRSACLLE